MKHPTHPSLTAETVETDARTARMAARIQPFLEKQLQEAEATFQETGVRQRLTLSLPHAYDIDIHEIPAIAYFIQNRLAGIRADYAKILRSIRVKIPPKAAPEPFYPEVEPIAIEDLAKATTETTPEMIRMGATSPDHIVVPKGKTKVDLGKPTT